MVELVTETLQTVENKVAKIMSKHHNVKVDPKIMLQLLSHNKTFEYRVNDRDYKEGDTITLQEFNQQSQTYTGMEYNFTIGFVLYGPEYGVPEGHCIFSLLYPHY